MDTPTSLHAKGIPHRSGLAHVQRAIARGTEAALGQQRSDGSWQSRNDAGPLFTGAALAFERALGVLRHEDAHDGERFLRHVQRPDGSAEAWPFAGRGSLEATSFWLAGMRAAGVPDDDPAVARARRYVAGEGGLGRNRVIVSALLAAVGVVEPRSLPRVPLWPRLVPGYTAGLGAVLGVNALVPAHTLPSMIRGLRDRDQPRSWLRQRIDADVVRYLDEHQDPSGAWAGVPYYSLQAALALHLSGVPSDDPRIVRAVEFSRSVWERRPEGLFVGAFHSTHWDTAHMIRVLAPLGVEHPAMRAATRYLLEGQAREPSFRDWQTAPRGAPPTGGWAWQPGNAKNPDLDSTAEVLSALGTLPADARGPEIDRAVSQALAWLLPFQNRDGGWGAFSHGKRPPPPGPLFVREPRHDGDGLVRRVSRARLHLARRLAEVGDPSTADVTGRVLYALGRLGFDRSDARVRAAIAFLRRHQLPSGAWWGRWSVNYLPATAYVVTGLLAVGEPASAPWVASAVRWMAARQNPDGGFGELPCSYEDPALAGCGPSSVQVTGIVAWALLCAGVRGDVVDRAIAWLLERQRPDGNWDDRACFGTVFPHLHYYHSDAFPLYFALEALHAYRR